MRKKLIDLLYEAEGLVNNELPTVEMVADYLLAHGVTIQKKNQKPKPRKRKQKEISQDTLNALNAIGQQSHREFADSCLFGQRNKIN